MAERELLQQAVEIFEARGDKADLLLKRLLGRNRLGKEQRAALYGSFYLYIRKRALVRALSARQSASDWARTAFALWNGKTGELDAALWDRYQSASPQLQRELQASYPSFWRQKMHEAFESDYERAASYLQQRAGITLLALLRRQSRAELIAALRQAGVAAEAAELSPAGIYVEGRLPKALNLFFEPQDEASQLAALVLSPESRKVLDFCCGNGGKSVAMGSYWPHKKLYAHDIRLNLLDKACARAAAAGISLKRQTKCQNGLYDTVFVDAPCSGSGVWRRNPEDRYRVDEAKLAALAELQQQLLLEAGKRTAFGGELIYVTCSFTLEENERNIERFLAKAKSFAPVNAFDRLKNNLEAFGLQNPPLASRYRQSAAPYLRSLPAGRADLFFVAVLKKRA